MLARLPQSRALCRPLQVKHAISPPRHGLRQAQRALPVLKEIIPEEDMLKLESMLDHFKLFDAEGNGKLGREELRKLLQTVEGYLPTTYSHLYCKDWLPEKELDRIMRLYDKDQNGVIDVAEFEELVYDGLLLDGKLREYEEAFGAVDKDGDGFIDSAELRELLHSLGETITAERLEGITGGHDTEKIGFGTFLAMFRDELLDLKEVMDYMATEPLKTRDMMQLLQDEGVHVVLSEGELEAVLLNPEGRLTVLFSTLTWCQASRKMQGHYSLLAQHYKDAFNFVKLYGNSNEDTKGLFRDKLRVRSTPCFMIFHGTELLYSQTGSDRGKLESALRAHAQGGAVPERRVFVPVMT